MPTRRQRSDSTEAIVKGMKDAAAPELVPPPHTRLRDTDMPFWRDIICARAREEWLPVDLVVAAQLSRCQNDIEIESQALQTEGSVIENQRGTMVANPRVNVLEQLARREMALMRTLRMGGRVSGDSRDDAARVKAQNQGKALRAELEDEDLLAS